MEDKILKPVVKNMIEENKNNDIVDFKLLKKVSDEVFKRNDYIYKVLSEC